MGTALIKGKEKRQASMTSIPLKKAIKIIVGIRLLQNEVLVDEQFLSSKVIITPFAVWPCVIFLL